MHFVNAEPLEFAQPQAREAGLAKAKLELAELAQTWLRTIADTEADTDFAPSLEHAI